MRRALVVWGGWDGHEPKPCVDVFIPWMAQEGFEVDVRDTLDVYADEAVMKDLSVIVQCWTMAEITGEQSEGLRNAVKEGVGLAGWHGGLCDSFRNDTGYQFMTGGQFVDHPGGIIDYEVNITHPDDPVMEGILDFPYRSEQYYMHVDPSNEVLATTTVGGEHFPWVQGCVMPVVWKRRYGAGHVFYSALGHVAKEFEEYPQALTIMQRGILWAAQ